MKAIMPAHSEEIERYTPRYVFEGLDVLFHLDPCALATHCPSKDFCKKFYSLELGQDGLELPWRDRVFVNPPWTRGAKRRWITRLKEHGNGIALVRGGVDSKWLHDNKPDALFVLRKRVAYLRADSKEERPRKGGAVGGFEPSMLLAYSRECVEILENCTLDGMFCRVRNA